MKHLGIQRIPDSLIRPCWRKDAKATVSCNPSFGPLALDALHSYRFGTLASDFNTLGFYASKYDDNFSKQDKTSRRFIEKFKNVFHLRDTDNVSSNREYEEENASTKNIIKDPVRAKTKGGEKEQNKLWHQQNNGPKEALRKDIVFVMS